MRLEILGCSGGVAKNSATTSFLVDDDLLIDAGTGLSSLDLEMSMQIGAVILTHSHLDHICHLPFLLNNTIGKTSRPLHVYALAETIDALRKHVFNNVIWPDFTLLPSKESPSLVFHTFSVGDELILGGKKITVLPADHTVASVGFHVSSGKSSFAFSGDTSHNQDFWCALNKLPHAEMVIVDNQYLEAEQVVSEKAKHYYAKSLKADYVLLSYTTKLYLTHLPPYAKKEVFNEAERVFSEEKIYALNEGQVYNFG
jgi:ribonuclease BN (tRNA processing enzyme)